MCVCVCLSVCLSACLLCVNIWLECMEASASRRINSRIAKILPFQKFSACAPGEFCRQRCRPQGRGSQGPRGLQAAWVLLPSAALRGNTQEPCAYKIDKHWLVDRCNATKRVF